jgi:hypothetical protein
LQKLSQNTKLDEKIAAAGPFIQFDSYLNSWMIHHLFLEYLQGFQNKLTKKEKYDIWKTAAKWCAENNRQIDALIYYEKAGDYNSIYLLVNTMPLYLPNRTAKLILEILERADDDIYQKNLFLFIIHNRALISLGLYSKAKGELENIIPKLEKEKNDPTGYRVLMGCYIALGYSCLHNVQITGDYSFVQYFEKANYYCKLSGYVSSLPSSVAAIGSYVCLVTKPEREEFDRYISTLTVIIPYAVSVMAGCLYGADDLARGELAFFSMDLLAAETTCLQLLQKPVRRISTKSKTAVSIIFSEYTCVRDALTRKKKYSGSLKPLLKNHSISTG